MEELDSLEKFAAVQAEELSRGRRNGYVTREEAEKYFEKVAEAALQEYAGEENDIDYEDLAVDVPGVDEVEVEQEMYRVLEGRQQKMEGLVDHLESGRIDDYGVEGVVAVRPTGIGPAAILADQYDTDWSVEMFHGNDTELPRDAENVVEHGYPGILEMIPGVSDFVTGTVSQVEFFGENYDGPVVLAGDTWGLEDGEADATLDAPEAGTVQRRIMEEGWNIPASVRAGNWVDEKSERVRDIL